MGASPTSQTPIEARVVLISLDGHLSAVVDRAKAQLRAEIPGLKLSFHAASDWARKPETLKACRDDIAKADIIVSSMLFLEDHIQAVLPDLKARRDECDAILGCLAASEVVQLTKLGQFDMSKPTSGPLALIKRLRGSGDKAKAGAKQMKTLRRLPRLLKYIPGTAQDVRAYFLSMQYWLAGSDQNITNLVRHLVNRYADGPRRALRGKHPPEPPVEYPDTGLYHPRMTPSVGTSASALPLHRANRPRIGVLIMRSYVTADDTGHYDGVIDALEARGLRVVPAYASGLDAREAIEQYFVKDGQPTIDALVSLTGFSLIGGPAFNDSGAASELLQRLDVPYVCGQALEFQSLSEWGQGAHGLTPVEATMMVAIPELDGATNPIVFGGRADQGSTCHGCDNHCSFNDGERRMRVCPERADMLARRVEKLVSLRRLDRTNRKVAITLFNFPPNGGAAGTAAHLDVFTSLHNFLKRLQADGYTVDVPESVEALRSRLLGGNSDRYGTDANVGAKLPVDSYVRREKRLGEIEAEWGPAPGRILTDGRNLLILGETLGNVFVGFQPSFGYEGDPMRLLFEKSFTPTHAFAAYYRYLKSELRADVVVHFGMHGALEFMPGKQVGLSGNCWPDSLIGDLPNVYFYAANNPSEAALAKRRIGAVTISHLTPPLTEAGLYKELVNLKSSIDRWRKRDAEVAEADDDLAQLIQAEAVILDLASSTPVWTATSEAEIEKVRRKLVELETSLIPEGLHVAGQVQPPKVRAQTLSNLPLFDDGEQLAPAAINAIANGTSAHSVAASLGLNDRLSALQHLEGVNSALSHSTELEALVHALDGGFTPPVSGGDLIRNPDILPTGRNIHGFDPFRLPSAYAVQDGARQADLLIDRYVEDHGRMPETVAVVLWGTDNLKSEGAQLAQVLSLIGAKPRTDSYGRLAGADLIPLEQLGRPRIDVLVTLSGIFRDLLPMQTRLIASAALAAAQADEPDEMNFVVKHVRAYMAENDCDLETAALRVFSNADGAYGSNINQLVEEGCWDDEDELADAFSRRKSFAYGQNGSPIAQASLMQNLLGKVDLAYQNLESVEVGLTTIDHYFDTLGGIGRAAAKQQGSEPSVYIGDHTRSDGAVRSLADQVALETRTRTLNPKWYEGMLRHGYEGVRQIEAQITNTMGWSATTRQVAPWVYQRMTETFVLDEDLRERLASLNPKACAKVANRLIEASERNYWQPDPETLAALMKAGEDLEDRVEGVTVSAGAAA